VRLRVDLVTAAELPAVQTLAKNAGKGRIRCFIIFSLAKAEGGGACIQTLTGPMQFKILAKAAGVFRSLRRPPEREGRGGPEVCS
jgi:hypothetical protein